MHREAPLRPTSSPVYNTKAPAYPKGGRSATPIPNRRVLRLVTIPRIGKRTNTAPLPSIAPILSWPTLAVPHRRQGWRRRSDFRRYRALPQNPRDKAANDSAYNGTGNITDREALDLGLVCIQSTIHPSCHDLNTLGSIPPEWFKPSQNGSLMG